MEGPAYKGLRAAKTKRNAITHPKTPDDLVIDAENKASLLRATEWFRRFLAAVDGSVVGEIDRRIADLKQLGDQLRPT